jgi:glycosyltransferase involved in cell wall biosynthesis
MKKGILYVSTFNIDVIGGGENYLVELASCIRNEFRIEFVTSTSNPTFKKTLEQHGYYTSSINGRLSSTLADARFLARLCKDRRMDIVHFNSRRDILLAHCLARYIKIPVVLTIHTTLISPYIGLLGKMKCLAYRVIFRLFGQNVQRYITVTQYNASLLHKLCGVNSNRIAAIHNGIKTVSAEEKPLITAQQKSPVIGVVSHLFPIKGIDILLQSMALLKSSAWVCYIIGDGPESGRLKALARKLELQDRVIFRGKLPRKEVYDIIKCCRMVVLPSWYESFPYSLLEAMSFGIPIITTQVPGLQEIIPEGKNGILVKPGQPDELKKAIHTLLDQPDLALKMGQEGKRLIMTSLSLENMAEQTQQVYNDILEAQN